MATLKLDDLNAEKEKLESTFIVPSFSCPVCRQKKIIPWYNRPINRLALENLRNNEEYEQAYEKYIKEKNKVNDKLFKLYENEKFRQYKWYAFINKKRTEDNMLNLIENKFGKAARENIVNMSKIKLKRKLLEKKQSFI